MPVAASTEGAGVGTLVGSLVAALTLSLTDEIGTIGPALTCEGILGPDGDGMPNVSLNFWATVIAAGERELALLISLANNCKSATEVSGANSELALLWELYAATTGWLPTIVIVSVAFSLALPSAARSSAKSARTPEAMPS